MVSLKVFKTHPEVVIPEFATENSACFDLAYQPHGKYHVDVFNEMNKPLQRNLSAAMGTIALAPNERALIPTGLIFDIPEGYSLRVHPRSGVSVNYGVTLINGEGVIDSDYVEEVFVLLHNTSSANYLLYPGNRIAQAELVKQETYTIEQIDLRPDRKTNRVGGMGSTGTATVSVITPAETQKFEVPVEQPVKRKRGRPRKNLIDNPS